jgi:hypothetical protein
MKIFLNGLEDKPVSGAVVVIGIPSEGPGAIKQHTYPPGAWAGKDKSVWTLETLPLSVTWIMPPYTRVAR